MKQLLETAACKDYSVASRLEWFLPNGLGGYAMGTVSGSNSRRYHGHLVAAVRPPTDRMVLLANIEAYALIGTTSVGLSTNQYVGAVHPQGYSLLESFSVGDHAEWTYKIGQDRIVKRLKVHKGENASTVEYLNLGSQTVQLTLRPLVCHKFYHDNFRVTDFYPQFLAFPEGRTVLTQNGVRLCLEHSAADRTPTTGWYYRFELVREAERGLDPLDDLYCPCELRYLLAPGETATLVAATEEDVSPEEFGEQPLWSEASTLDLLKYSAEKFLVQTPVRTTIIAGYPWFTDWGRDTMISLPGLCLSTGKWDVAASLLRSYAAAIDQGMVPNRFSDNDDQPEFNSVDATLWFVNATYLTLSDQWDDTLAQEANEWVDEILKWHVKGTRFGIAMDPQDGLLRQGAPGVQLTWMDAKVGDWVVTPRHGKPVEVNGLWINALSVAVWLKQKLNLPFEEWEAKATKARASFAGKFWKATVGHYLDTVEPDDASLRPNQLIAMALPFGPAEGDTARRALSKVKTELLTLNGVRTLGPNEPGYHGRYEGGVQERDTAYHQGTSWPWLIGPYVSAVLRLSGDVQEARSVLGSARNWLEEYGLGGIAEVYSGDPPQRPGGCPWQAWSVAETLRAWVETDNFEKPGTGPDGAR